MGVRPDLDRRAVERFLQQRLGCSVQGLRALKPGELCKVYAFVADGHEFVIRLGTMRESFERDRYAFENFGSPRVPIPRIVEIGRFDDLWFAISDRLPGTPMFDLPRDEYARAIPSLVEVLDAIHATDVSATSGFGPLGSDGDGTRPTWRGFVELIGDEEQTGFWAGWTDLFRTSFLDRATFHSLRRRVLDLTPFASEERHLVHGDYGLDNVLVRDARVTGVLDWANVKYGDFVFDVAWLNLWSAQDDLAEVFRQHYRAQGRSVSDFDQRLRCYTYCHALDALRFYAKVNRRESYDWVLDRLRALGL
jgi:hygromycin-B 4-O-kinase